MRVSLAFVMVAVACAAIVWLARDLWPPKHLVFAAGAEGGGYERIAKRYQAILARDGIRMEILTTGGSVENVRLLAEGKAQAALLQGGVKGPEGADSLGAVFLEPLFVFVRADRDIAANPASWQGLKIAGGGEGSGTRAAVLAFAQAAQITPGANELLSFGNTEAMEALLAGEIDAALLVAPLSAPYLEPLFRSDEIRLLRLDLIEAISRRLAQSQVVNLPAGAIRMLPTVPPGDTAMLAMVAQIIAVDDLHPSLVDRLVEAAREIHSRQDAITGSNQFPSMDAISLPADDYARQLMEDGPSSLQKLLPYWVVAQINRFAILLLPIIFLLLPAFRLLPALYAWQMRSRVYRYYDDIRRIDRQLHAQPEPEVLSALNIRLQQIDENIAALHLPLAYREYAYTARLHIELLKKQIAERLENEQGAE